MTDEQSSPPETMKNVVQKDPQTYWALGAHLLGLTYFIGIPGFIGPLVLYLIMDKNSIFARDHAREALNFQINAFIWILISTALCLVLIGFAMLPIVGLAAIIFPIIGAIKASDQADYKYPFIYRFI